MNNNRESWNFKRSSRKRLTVGIDRIFGDLEILESPSPSEVTKQMTTTFRELGTLREKIKKQDLNPENFKANHKYQQAKDKIKSYIDTKYNKNSLRDSRRMTEILQNRPLTDFYKPSQKLLFDSMEEISGVIKNNKRKFGEFWEITPKLSLSAKLPDVFQAVVNKKREKTPKNARLSKLITKLMVKNLGIRTREAFSPRCSLSGSPDKSGSGSPESVNWRYGKIKGRMSNAIEAFEETDEIVFNDEQYFAPEFKKYVSDVDNCLKVQRYIGQNSEKRKKMGMMNSKFSRAD